VIPDEAVEAGLVAWADRKAVWPRDVVRHILEAAAPHILAEKVAEAKANNDHIVEGADGYSAGFHYALHCISGREEDTTDGND